jgi:hypothetical protein
MSRELASAGFDEFMPIGPIETRPHVCDGIMQRGEANGWQEYSELKLRFPFGLRVAGRCTGVLKLR